MAERRVKLKTRTLERGKSAPLIVVSQNEDGKSSNKVDPTLLGLKMGHEFKKRTFYKPTYCQHCSDLLWGLINQGYHCTVCSYICHEKCIPTIMTDCIHLKAEKIVENAPHKWIGPEDKKKKKWCNICRKKITGPTWYCGVCRCYSHAECRDNSFNDCKRCAIYSKISNPAVPHHWVEGNLPSSSKCEVCTKSCSTDLCLFGFKCGWCGVTVHSNCLESFMLIPRNTRCTFRDLKYMMLSPTSITMYIKDYAIGEEITSLDDVCTTDLYSPVTEDSHSLGADDSDSNKGRAVLIIDGSGGPTGAKKWRKKTVQSVPVPKKMSAEELLRISLRKIGISTCPDDFALFELLDASSGSERKVEPNENPYYFRQSYNGPLKLYVRRNQEMESDLKHTLKLFNSNLPSDKPFIECEIDNRITFADVIVKGIQLFNLEDKVSSNYCIYENSMEMCEKEVELSGKPLKRIEQLTDESLALLSSLRFYLSVKEEVSVELYVWKVPADSLKDEHTVSLYMRNVLQQQQGNYEIGPLFPSQGGFIITMKDLVEAQKLCDSNSNIYPIPRIHEDSINSDKEPLLVFVNTKSGGKQGVKLITAFNRHLNPHQVFDLLSGGPIPGLYAFRNLKKYRILVAGGDGTVGWVLGALDDMKGYCGADSMCSPPCGVIPLGTGNDLARALKWGSGYTGEKVMQLLLSVEDADAVEFDRWVIDFQDPLDGLTDLSQSKQVIMNNYFGIGIDGEIALDFHQAREENPDKFNSRLHNKGVYLQLGVQKTFSRDTSSDFSTQVYLEVNGNNVKLPFGLKGLVLLNIPSWGAGAEPWGNHSDQEFDKCSFSDGKMEVMGLNGAMHIGQIKSGIRGGIRIAQGNDVKITLEETLPIQIDGEAWMQSPMVISISKAQTDTAMLVKSARDHFTRGLHDNQARSLVSRQTVIGQDHSQMSNRRGHTLNQTMTQPSLIGTSTRTLYIKDKKNKDKDSNDIKEL